jgi:hypothetical protein
MFQGSHHMIINGGNFIQNEGTGFVLRPILVSFSLIDYHIYLTYSKSKILFMHYLTIALLFG